MQSEGSVHKKEGLLLHGTTPQRPGAEFASGCQKSYR